MKIKNVKAHEILDSRGTPTIQCLLELSDGAIVSSSVPSGASVGGQEAYELRDHDQRRFLGKGVLRACNLIEHELSPLLVGQAPSVKKLDHVLIEYDGTSDKSRLGANTCLAISQVVARAQAHVAEKELFYVLSEEFSAKKMALPRCLFNVINGGLHANNDLLFQEFLLIPKKEKPFNELLSMIMNIYYQLRNIFSRNGIFCGVGDEGGLTPFFHEDGLAKISTACDCLLDAIHSAGYSDDDVTFGIDVAATQFYDSARKAYIIGSERLNSNDLVAFYAELSAAYPLTLIEDGLSEHDMIGWALLTQRLGATTQLIGDDLLVTSAEKIRTAAGLKNANGAIIKPNQRGTLSEAVAAVQACRDVSYSTVASHRSGETNDPFIADFAVGLNTSFLKAGAPVRGERVAKYNRLLEIEELLKKY